MIHLEINNVRTRLENADPVTTRGIRELLSYEPDGVEHIRRNLHPAIRKKYSGRVYLLKYNKFPTGLLPKVITWIKESKLKYTFKDLRVKPEFEIDYKFNCHLDPRDYQKAAVKAAKGSTRGIVEVGTGGGKSLIIAMTIKDKGVPTLIITPDTGIREQLLKNYQKWFGDQVSKELKDNTPIVVSNIQTLSRRDVDVFKRFKMITTDEYHHCLCKSALIQDNYKRWKTIKEIYDKFHLKKNELKVKSWDGDKFVSKKVTGAFRYIAPKVMRKITIEDKDGKIKELIVTGNHDIYTDDGKKRACSIRVGDEIALGYTTHSQAMENRSKNKEYRKYLSDRMKKKNPATSESFKKQQSKRIKDAMAKGEWNPYGRGEYGNGGKMTPAQIFLHKLLPDTIPELSIALGDGEHPYHYKIDLAFPDQKVGIEIDGNSHKRRKQIDERKDKRLAKIGWKIIRVSENGIRDCITS